MKTKTAIPLLLTLALAGCSPSDNSLDICCEMGGQADPGGLPPGPPAVLATSEAAAVGDVTVELLQYDDEFNLTTVLDRTVTNADLDYYYTFSVPEDALGATNLVVRATSGDREGFVAPAQAPADGRFVPLPPMDQETSLEARVERQALKFWSTSVDAPNWFPGQPVRALTRLEIRSSLAEDEGDVYDPSLADGLGATVVLNQVGQYLSYKRLWDDPNAVNAAPVNWPSLTAAVNEVLIAADAAAYVSETPVDPEVEVLAQDVIRNAIAGIPGVQGWRAACRMAEAEHVRSDIYELNLPAGVLGGATGAANPTLTRIQAEEGLRLMRAHRRAWLVDSGDSSIISQLTMVLGPPPGPPAFIETAETQFAALLADPANPELSYEGIWQGYSAISRNFMETWIDNALGAGGDWTNALNQMSGVKAGYLGTPNGEGSRVPGLSPTDAEQGVHAIFAEARTQTDVGFTGTTAEARRIFGCAAFLTEIRDLRTPN